MNTIIGREQELSRLQAFVRDAPTGAALVLHGEIGVGKTSLLAEAISLARRAGIHVLTARGAEFESEIGYSSLHQLLLPCVAHLDRLETGLRSGLSVALGRVAGPSPDPILVCNASMALLNEAGGQSPILMTVDDLQWVDAATSLVLGLIARRVQGTGISVLTAQRSGRDTFLGRSGLPDLPVEALDGGSSAALVRARSPALPDSIVQSVVREAEGNPLALIELAGMANDAPDQFLSDTGRRPLSRRLELLFQPRIAELPSDTRKLLVLLALEGSGDLALLGGSGDGPSLLTAIETAEAAGLVRVLPSGRRAEFTHPLVRAALVNGSTFSDRREAHGRLAKLLAGEQERAAWHLAAATLGTDESVAEAVHQAARSMLRRGDATGAAETMLRSAELTPNDRDRSRRLSEAAFIAARVNGSFALADKLLDDPDLLTADSPQLLTTAIAAAFTLLAVNGEISVSQRLILKTLDLQDPADSDDATIAEALWALLNLAISSAEPAMFTAFEEALKRFKACAPRLLELTAAAADPVRMDADDLAELDHELDGVDSVGDLVQIIRLAYAGLFLSRLERCEPALRRVVESARGGAALASVQALQFLANDEFFRGRWNVANDLAQQALQACDNHGLELRNGSILVMTRICAVTGRYDESFSMAEELASWAEPRGLGIVSPPIVHSRALAAAGQGDWDGCYRELAEVYPPGEFPRYKPALLWATFDLVEAAVRTGRNSEAAKHVSAMDHVGFSRLSPQHALLAAGCAALVADDRGAAERFREAVSLPGAEQWTFDLARIRLAQGIHLRRLRQTTAARSVLTKAVEAFERLGATPWAEQARLARGAASGRRRSSSVELGAALTDQERAVAELAAAGMTNKEIAAQLFISARTVSTHLYRVFPKVGVSTRAALRDALLNAQEERASTD